MAVAGKGNVGCMTMQTPGLKNSSPGMTDTGQSITRATKQEWKTGFGMSMEEVAGTQKSCGFGRPSSSEEMLSRLLRKFFSRSAAMFAQHGGEWIIFYIVF